MPFPPYVKSVVLGLSLIILPAFTKRRREILVERFTRRTMTQKYAAQLRLAEELILNKMWILEISTYGFTALPDGLSISIFVSK